MRVRDRMLAAVLALTAVGTASVAFGAPAWADDLSTTTRFTDTAVDLKFGDDWSVPITVTNRVSFEGDGTEGTDAPVEPSAGTIDVYLDGFPGVWASGLPLSPGGVAYLAQASARTPLGSGKHSFTAVFQPGAGSGLQTSKTTTPLVVSVTGFALTSHAVIVDDPAAVAQPTVRLSLSGAWIDEHHSAPAGTWSMTVTDTASDRVVLRRGFVQRAATTPIEVPFGYRTTAGHAYRIDAVYSPAIYLAPGLQLTAAPPLRYRTEDPPPLAFLVTPLPFPLWLAAVLGGALVLLAATAVVIAAVSARARGRIAALQPTPGAPNGTSPTAAPPPPPPAPPPSPSTGY